MPIDNEKRARILQAWRFSFYVTSICCLAFWISRLYDFEGLMMTSILPMAPGLAIALIPASLAWDEFSPNTVILVFLTPLLNLAFYALMAYSWLNFRAVSTRKSR